MAIPKHIYCMLSIMKEDCFIYAYLIIHLVLFPSGIFLNSLKKNLWKAET